MAVESGGKISLYPVIVDFTFLISLFNVIKSEFLAEIGHIIK